LINKGGNPLQ